MNIYQDCVCFLKGFFVRPENFSQKHTDCRQKHLCINKNHIILMGTIYIFMVVSQIPGKMSMLWNQYLWTHMWFLQPKFNEYIVADGARNTNCWVRNTSSCVFLGALSCWLAMSSNILQSIFCRVGIIWLKENITFLLQEGQHNRWIKFYAVLFVTLTMWSWLASVLYTHPKLGLHVLDKNVHLTTIVNIKALLMHHIQ